MRDEKGKRRREENTVPGNVGGRFVPGGKEVKKKGGGGKGMSRVLKKKAGVSKKNGAETETRWVGEDRNPGAPGGGTTCP